MGETAAKPFNWTETQWTYSYNSPLERILAAHKAIGDKPLAFGLVYGENCCLCSSVD